MIILIFRTIEYCVTVGNLSSSVTDVDLFKLFAKKYVSCRAAKIHFHPNGKSKGFGIVKFHNQTDQQLALVEFNKYNFKGRDIHVKLAPTKTRGPKGMMGNMNPMQGMYAPPGFMPNVMGAPYTLPIDPLRDLGRSSSRDERRSRRSRSRDRDRRRGDRSRRSRSTSKERKRRYWKLDEFVKDQRQKYVDSTLMTTPMQWAQGIFWK